MSDMEILGGMIPEAEGLSSSEDEDGEDENWLTDIYRSPKHLLNEDHVISALLEDIEDRNSPISLQLLTLIQESQVESPPMPASPLAVLNEPIPQTVVTMPLIDPRTDGQFTIDAPKTWAGQKQKVRDLHSMLVVCTCGLAVLESEISRNANIIKCNCAGCKMSWVSQIIHFKGGRTNS